MKDKHQTSPYPLRMPGQLRAALSVSANANKRSLHGEIVMRLENTVKQDQRVAAQGGLQ